MGRKIALNTICLFLLLIGSVHPETDPCEKDPLDTKCPKSITLWPNDSPLNPQTAKLCDKNIQILFNNHKITECDDDPSCKECRVEEAKLFKVLEKSFDSNKDITKNRDEMLESLKTNLKRSSTNGYMFVVGVTSQQLDFFVNWACSVELNLMIDPRKVTYIITTDTETHEKLTTLGFIVEPLKWVEEAQKYAKSKFKIADFKKQFLSPDGTGFNEGKKYGPLHSSINTVVTMAVDYFIQNDLKVIQMDVDSVFVAGFVKLFPQNVATENRDNTHVGLFEYLDRALERRDIVGMMHKSDDQYGNFNTGFIVYNPTFFTQRFTETMVLMNEIKLKSDQELFNTVVRHYRMQQLTKRVLSPRLFSLIPLQETEAFNVEDVVVAHAYGSNAQTRLKKHGLWVLLEEGQVREKGVASCSLLEELDEMSEEKVKVKEIITTHMPEEQETKKVQEEGSEQVLEEQKETIPPRIPDGKETKKIPGEHQTGKDN